MDLTRHKRKRILTLWLYPDPVEGPRSAAKIGRIVGCGETTIYRFLREAAERVMREVPMERMLDLLDSEGERVGILEKVLDALDLEETAADIERLAELIQSGEWRNNRREAAGLGFCVLGCLSLKAAALCGHDPHNVAATSPKFEAALGKLGTACGYQPDEVATGPITNAILLAILQELIRRLPDLLDLFDED